MIPFPSQHYKLGCNTASSRRTQNETGKNPAAELIREWLMEDDFQPVAGHKFNFRKTPMPHWNGVTDCEF
jgi:hypothetical protein